MECSASLPVIYVVGAIKAQHTWLDYLQGHSWNFYGLNLEVWKKKKESFKFSEEKKFALIILLLGDITMVIKAGNTETFTE